MFCRLIAGLVVSALAAFGLLAVTQPAGAGPVAPADGNCGLACPTGPPTGGGGPGGKIYAQTIHVSVSHVGGVSGSPGTGGGAYSVPSPCGYQSWGSNATMEALVTVIGFFPIVGGLLQLFFPSPAELHAHDGDKTGYWFGATCKAVPPHNPPTSADAALLQAEKDWGKINRPWVFVNPANPPMPPVSAGILSAYAYNAAVNAIPTPTVNIAPRGQTLTQAKTLVWLNRGNISPVSATATAANSPTVTVRADNKGVAFNNLPAGAEADPACTNGGTPYRPGSSPGNCWIRFVAPSRGVSFTVSTTWHISVTGGPLTGADTEVRTSAPVTVAVAQSQAVGTR